MPDLPSLLVFDVNIRISKAKIQKYRLATERGMVRSCTTTLLDTPSPTSEDLRSAMEPPPAKKSRLRTQATKRKASPDTIAVAMPRRDSSPGTKDSEPMDVDTSHVPSSKLSLKPSPSPTAISDVSSTLSPVPSDAEMQSPEKKELTPNADSDAEYGRNFMSYYIADEPEEEEKTKKEKPAKRTKRKNNADLPPPMQSQQQKESLPLRQQGQTPQQIPPPQQVSSLRQDQPSQPGLPPPQHIPQTQQDPAPQQSPSSHPPAHQHDKTQHRHPGRARIYSAHTRRSLHQQQAQRDYAAQQQHLQAPIPQPGVHVVDDIRRSTGVRELETVATQLQKVKRLSESLVTFGGIQPDPQSPSSKHSAMGANTPAGRPDAAAQKDTDEDGDENPLDDLLAIFDGDENFEDGKNNGSAKASAVPKQRSLDFVLEHTGCPDSSLIYGIEFIMNALKTWASQRLTDMSIQTYRQHEMQRRRQELQALSSRRPTGRPRKSDADRLHALEQTRVPVFIHYLSTTLEGAAIQAFQDVLESGALQVNGVLPVELTRALRYLYLQIDHLINKSTNEPQQWQCMSYSAQMMAQKIKVTRFNEMYTRAQEEMAQQQQLAQQTMYQQKGIPSHMQHHGAMSPTELQKIHEMTLEQRRGMQYASREPHLSQYIARPMEMERPNEPRRSAASAAASPVQGSAKDTATAASHKPKSSSKRPSSSLPREVMSNITMYHGGQPHGVAPEHASMMRSGSNFKFSFAPANPLAVQAFGSQAFPTNVEESSIPRRGPMAPVPTSQQVPSNDHDGDVQLQQPPSPSAATAGAVRDSEGGMASSSVSPTLQTNGESGERAFFAASPSLQQQDGSQQDFADTSAGASRMAQQDGPVTLQNGFHPASEPTTSASPAVQHPEAPPPLSAKVRGKQKMTSTDEVQEMTPEEATPMDLDD